ncbi:hypothetical protein AX15_004480 [Amanita polypyramis BW_CC]|nr:hypothetical protein AX15_004480 [Amanita polypyramis BW_CC]
MPFPEQLAPDNHAASGNKMNASSSSRTASGILLDSSSPSNSSSPRSPEQRWTVFSQLMENDAQLNSTLLASCQTYNTPCASDDVYEGFAGTTHEACASGLKSSTSSVFGSCVGVPSTTPSHENFRTPEDSYRGELDIDRPFRQPQTYLNTCNFLKHRLAELSPLHRNVLKCSIAYFTASLFTFCPYLSNFISDLTSYGPGNAVSTPSGHMVATIAVYYNPAKTIGGMLEADLFCVFGLIYASIVCLCSMSLFWWLELQPGWEWLGDVIAILWIGVSMSAVAWMKAWMGSPSFNTACSMIAIIIFVVLVKEGGLFTLLQVSAVVICGSVISNIICYIFWPQTATTNLERDIAQTLESFATLLTRLTDTFLLENSPSSRGTMREKLHKAVEDHQKSFTMLRKNLDESRSERLYKSWKDYESVVDGMNRLAQHLNGLRSSTKLQYELVASRAHRRDSRIYHRPVDEHEWRSGKDGVAVPTAAAIFESLVDELSSPLKNLKVTCVYALEKLHKAFEGMNTKLQDNTAKVDLQDFAELVEVIEVALLRFDATSDRAILRFYRQDSSHLHDLGHPELDQEYKRGKEQRHTSVTQEHEVVFLVYFFVFTLQEFGRELILLVECIERIYVQVKLRQSRSPSLLQSATGLLLSLRKSDNYTRRLISRRSLSHIISMNRRFHYSFPKIHPHAPDTIQTPSWSHLSRAGRLKKILWTLGKMLVEQRSKYAIKAGMATAILASPAFYDGTRPMFIEYWGDWALISCFVVLSPTIGATNYLSLHRIVGTLFGAAVAAAIFSLFSEHPAVLSIFGFAFSIPCFYYALSRPQYASASRFVLLTYNLTCLYCYNQREKDVDVLDIAVHRGLAVTVGVLWAAVISRLWWPSEARRELNNALGEFCLKLGWLYTRLVASNSSTFKQCGRYEVEGQSGGGVLPTEETGTNLHNSVKEFMAMELHLQIKLIEIQGLLAQAQHEPRLKGPFPVLLYRDVLISLQTIIDNLHSIRCVTTREEWYAAF